MCATVVTVWENLEKMINAVEETQKRGVNRAEHRLHLRCELPHHTTLPLFEKLVGREPVTLVSLMDHSPASVSSPIVRSTASIIGAVFAHRRADGPL